MPAVSIPPAEQDRSCFSHQHVGQIFSAQLVVSLPGKFKLSIMAGSLKLWRCVVNVYASITLIVAGIYRAAPLGSIPALVCRFMGSL